LLGGEVITTLSWPELATRRAMLPQRQPQLFHIPVFQVLSLGLEEGGPDAQAQAVADVCDALELAPLLARDFSRLSGGEQQRVLIARTLLQLWPSLNPTGRVLLLDEPWRGWICIIRWRCCGCSSNWPRRDCWWWWPSTTSIWPSTGRIACSACNRAAWWGRDVGIIDEALLARVFQIRTDRIEAAGRTWFMPSL
jgi:vitamin B12 transport system ATP-binding protein